MCEGSERMGGLQAGGRWGRGSATKHAAELGRERVSATGPLRGLGQVMNDQTCTFKQDSGNWVEQDPEGGK